MSTDKYQHNNRELKLCGAEQKAAGFLHGAGPEENSSGDTEWQQHPRMLQAALPDRLLIRTKKLTAASLQGAEFPSALGAMGWRAQAPPTKAAV